MTLSSIETEVEFEMCKNLKPSTQAKVKNLHMTLSSIETEVEFALASSTLNLFYFSMISEWSTIVYYKKYIDLLTETHCTSIVVNGCPRNLIK